MSLRRLAEISQPCYLARCPISCLRGLLRTDVEVSLQVNQIAYSATFTNTVEASLFRRFSRNIERSTALRMTCWATCCGNYFPGRPLAAGNPLTWVRTAAVIQ